MANILANNQAHIKSVSENLLARSGFITEGSHTSVFFVRDGVVYTHPEGNYILPGITPRTVPNDLISPLFMASIEATEEAILNSLFMATTIVGKDGRRVEALPLERVMPILKKYGAVSKD